MSKHETGWNRSAGVRSFRGWAKTCGLGNKATEIKTCVDEKGREGRKKSWKGMHCTKTNTKRTIIFQTN